MNLLQNPYELSYWEYDVFFQDIDVVIVGSGIVGLSAAIRLHEQEPGLKVLILERGPLPIGASTRNAGFACFGSMTELLADLDRHGEDTVWNLVRMRWEGLRRLRERVGDSGLAYKACGGFELFRSDDIEIYDRCCANLQSFNRIVRDITGVDEVFMPADKKIAGFGLDRIEHLIENTQEGQLHPGKLIQQLLAHARSSGVQIFTGLPVNELSDEGDRVVLNVGPGWDIYASRVLVATNALSRQLVKGLPVVPARNQVMITRPVPGLAIHGTFHYDQGYYYFRDIDGRLLIGGGRNLAIEEEQTPELGTTPLIRAALMRLAQEVVLPGQRFEVEKWWSGLLGMGEAKTPILKPATENIAVAVRLGGMGIAIGSLLGEQGADLVLRSRHAAGR